jgi:hypothetical protein
MEHNVRPVLTQAFAIAKPFLAVFVKASNHFARVVNSTVSTRVWGQFIEIVGLNFFLGFILISEDTSSRLTDAIRVIVCKVIPESVLLFFQLLDKLVVFISTG